MSAAFAARLREITRGIVTETGSADPHVVAAHVIGRLTPRQYREALEVCLGDWVRREMTLAVRQPVPSAADEAPSPKPGRHKAQRIRESAWYRALLAGPLHCGDDGWKPVRDCTAEDLHAAAESRYRKAAETHAEGDRWTKVALFMEEHSRATVADINETELRQLMEGS